MSTKTDMPESDSKLDLVRWLSVAILLSIGLFGFYYFAENSLLLRVVVLLGLVAGSVVIALQTVKGQFARGFLQDAYIEVRKVIWPSRQETVQTTGIVIVAVIIVALMVWMLDSILLWLVRLLVGQGG